MSVCVPCAGRPQRTRRLLYHLQSQTMKNFELLLVGDACPDFQEMIQSEWFNEWKTNFCDSGRRLVFYNLPQKGGGYGAAAINWAISQATGKYTCFIGNDDIVIPEHCQFYYTSIAGPGIYSRIDFVFNKTMLNSGHGFFERDPSLKFGSVGHSELVIRTDFLKIMPPHGPEHGHDWNLIKNMISSSGKYHKGSTPFPTYYVMGTDDYREQGID